jgi:hypothetical protein
VVHYVAYGTPGGEYPKTCRAAIVTEEPALEDPKGKLGLAVLNPTGIFFHAIGDGGCEYDRGAVDGGTWHWPQDDGL